jgi:hypothetical protein
MSGDTSFEEQVYVDTTIGTATGGRGGGARAADPPLGPMGSWDIPGDPPGDFAKLVGMLTRMKATMALLIELTPPIIPEELQKPLQANWPVARGYLDLAIAKLEHETETPLGHYMQQELFQRLATVGLTGEMLAMKETTLDYALDHLDPLLVLPQPLTLTESKESWKDRLVVKVVRWLHPASEVMNSILGSLLGHIPGGDVVKEMKDHLNASYGIAAAMKEDREDGD